MAGGTPHADVYAARLGDSSLGLLPVALGWVGTMANETDGRC